MKSCRGRVLVNILATLLLLEIAAIAALAGYLILTRQVTEDRMWLSSSGLSTRARPAN